MIQSEARQPTSRAIQCHLYNELRLRFCQERMRAQSPTPPLLKPKRLKGVGLYASERERGRILKGSIIAGIFC